MSQSTVAFIESLEDYELDPSLVGGFMINNILVLPLKQTLVIDNVHHHISTTAIELLGILSTYSTKIVSRQAIMDYFENPLTHKKANISTIISELRAALGDQANAPQFIQTIPRQGYRLIPHAAPLDQSILTPEVIMAASGENAAIQKQKWLGIFDVDYIRNSSFFKIAGTYIVMAWVLMQVVSVSTPTLNLVKWFDKLTLLILVVGFPMVLWYNWWSEFKLRKKFIKTRNKVWAEQHLSRYAYRDVRYISFFTFCSIVLSFFLTDQLLDVTNKSNQASVKNANVIEAKFLPNALAIMPFKTLSSAKNSDFVDLIQTELLIFLSQTPGLKVVSERVLSSLPIDASIEKIRTLTGAKYILEGNVNQLDNSSDIRFTLIDSQTGIQVWTARVNTENNEALSVFETISKQVHNAITFLKLEKDDSTPSFRPTSNIEAYDFYIRAKSALKDAYNSDQLKVAENLYLQALNRDNKFKLAHVGLCQTYIEQYLLSSIAEIFNLAKQACEVSSSNPANEAESEFSLGMLYLTSGDYNKALQYFDAGLKRQPNNSIGLTGKARTLARLDMQDLAKALYLEAIRVEPGYWQNYEKYGFYLFETGQYFDASLQFYKQSLLQTSSEEAFNNLGAAYYLDSKFDKATQSWQKALAINPSANTYSNLGTSLFLEKKFLSAIEMYQEAVKLNPSKHILKGNLADAMKYAGGFEQQSKDLYQQALDLARQNSAVNPNNPTSMASIARYQSELEACESSTNIVNSIRKFEIEDPYIFYDIALSLINCGSTTEVLANIQKALHLGYPRNLLLSDHQFEKYRIQIESL